MHSVIVVGCLVAALLVGCACGTACRFSQQVQTVYNSDCKDPLEPYCNNAQLCAPCHPSRLGSFYAMCDCPPNQYCFPTASNPDYGRCVPFNLDGVGCVSYLDCRIASQSGSGGAAIGYWSCVEGKCTPCNQSTYGNDTITCPGGSPYPNSSRPGETRQCGPDGYWVGGGQINVGGGSTTTPAQTATTKPPATTSGSSAHRRGMSAFFPSLAVAVAATVTWRAVAAALLY